MMKTKYTFLNGKTYHLDHAYAVLALIPVDCYDQDDTADRKYTNQNDSGETLRFIKTVTITVDVKVKDNP
jgi:hypothetical protein